MRTIIILVAFISIFDAEAQQKKSIFIIDRIQVPTEKREEAIYYYENNWKLYRDVALEKGAIHSYRFLEVESKSTAHFEFLLITEFSDSTQFDAVETNFEPIMRKVRPDGPVLLDEVQPSEFRKIISNDLARGLFQPDQ
ncbi:MAG: hypothetical protein RLN86_13800 [Cyclobacteriaceae bacterium]